jgi:3',5'-cyclic AMP phosphodiesterase CpdA
MTTVVRTLAPAGPGPFRRLIAARGEPHRRASFSNAIDDPTRMRGLCALVHLSDVHVTDPASPLRAAFLNHLGQPGGPLREALGPLGTYRPHEPLALHVLAAMLEAVVCIERSPVFGLPLETLIASGDLVDNAQQNELDRALRLLDGNAAVQPLGIANGWEGPGSWEGETWAWHPDGPPRDRWRTELGFPAAPGLFDALCDPVTAPWRATTTLVVEGNHDVLVQGTIPPTPRLSRFARGSWGLLAPAPDLDLATLLANHDHMAPDPTLLLPGAAVRPVTPDHSRRLRSADADPFKRCARLDISGVRLLVLDTTNPYGGWQGSLSHETMRWLESELEAAHSARVDEEGRRVPAPGTDVPVVIVSHHPLETLVNTTTLPGTPPRSGTREVTTLLARYPNVVAWLAGHTHRHRIRWARSPFGPFGVVHITTASLIDWPQQARIIEFGLDRGSGHLVIATTVVDHAGWVEKTQWEEPRGTRTLAGIARALAANDPERADGTEPPGRGQDADRNVLVAVPLSSRLLRGIGADLAGA